MLKRKFGNRSEWGRVLQRDYAQAYVETDDFRGYITLFKIIKVTEPLYVTYNENQLCIVDDGYIWVQQFPFDRRHSVTTMFDEKGQILQWYIDICYMNGVNEENVPWMDDLFLDIIVLPSGEVIQKDENELNEALLHGVINERLYNLAKQEAYTINKQISNGDFNLLHLTNQHKDFLIKKLKDQLN
jgi:uncharacterized protein